MQNTLIELYAKSTTSIIVQKSPKQMIIDHFFSQNQSSQVLQIEINLKKIQKEMAEKMYSVYQSMMLSIQTLFLGLQIMETYELKNFMNQEFQQRRILSTRSCFQYVNESLQKQSENQLDKILNSVIKDLAQIYAVSLLYVCHKITDDFKRKFTSNVWIQRLCLEQMTKQDIVKVENKIVSILEFDIIRPTVFTLTSVLMENMKIQKAEFAYFVHYLLELYLNTNICKFIGCQNRIKRVYLTLGSIKLAIHFFYPKLWNQNILSNLNFEQSQVQKYSRTLFGLLMNKQENRQIHQKYKHSRYRSISKIKIFNCQKREC